MKVAFDFYYFKESGKWAYQGVEDFEINSVEHYYGIMEELRLRHAKNDLPGCTTPSQYRTIVIPRNDDYGWPQCFLPVGAKQEPTILELQKAAFEWAVAQGFWDQADVRRLDPERLSVQAILVISMKLMHISAELGEAFEELRSRTPPSYKKDGKPEGFGVELADAVIMILDIAQALNIDLGEVILEKMEYNKTRPRMHEKAVG